MTRVDDTRFDAQRAEWQMAGTHAGSLLWDADVSARAHGAATNCEGGPSTIRELAARPRSAVARMRNVGAVTLAELDALLAFCGLTWAPEPTKESP